MNKKSGNRKRIEGVWCYSICLLFLFLTGCGKIELRDGVNLILEKNGSLIEQIQTDFPQELYDQNEFNAMNQKEVEEYNAKVGSEAVKILSSEADGEKIFVSTQYQTVNDYCNRNNLSMFVGTGKEAIAKEYAISGDFLDSSKERLHKQLTKEDLMKYHVVILNDPVTVHSYKKIMYTTENVTVSDNKKMATITGEGTAIIVFK